MTGPNLWYDTPLECMHLQRDEFATSCPAYIQNLQSLVLDTCEASIEKVCNFAYTNNPPFSCTARLHYPILTVIANTVSNTNAVWGALSAIVAMVLTQIFKQGEKKKKEDIETATTIVTATATATPTSTNAQKSDLVLEEVDDDILSKTVESDVKGKPSTATVELPSASEPPKVESKSLLLTVIDSLLPPSYFKTDEKYIKPKAPYNVLITSATMTLTVTPLAFALLFWYFSSVAYVIDTRISETYLTGTYAEDCINGGLSAVKCDPWQCDVLHPRVGSRYVSTSNSENMQFTGSYMRFDECVNYLQDRGVCDEKKGIKLAVELKGFTVQQDILTALGKGGVCADNRLFMRRNANPHELSFPLSVVKHNVTIFPTPIPSSESFSPKDYHLILTGDSITKVTVDCNSNTEDSFFDAGFCAIFCMGKGTSSVRRIDTSSTSTVAATTQFSNLQPAYASYIFPQAGSSCVFVIYNGIAYSIDTSNSILFELSLVSGADATPVVWTDADVTQAVADYVQNYLQSNSLGRFEIDAYTGVLHLVYDSQNVPINKYFDPATRKLASASKVADALPSYTAVSQNLAKSEFAFFNQESLTPDYTISTASNQKVYYYFVHRATSRNDYG